jgi:hypothetical protein
MIAEQKEPRYYTIPILITIGLIGTCICRQRGYVL